MYIGMQSLTRSYCNNEHSFAGNCLWDTIYSLALNNKFVMQFLSFYIPMKVMLMLLKLYFAVDILCISHNVLAESKFLFIYVVYSNI